MPNRVLPPDEDLITMYESGMSAGEIAETISAKVITVGSRLGLLSKAGRLKMRTPSEAQNLLNSRGRKPVVKYWQGKKQPPEMVENRVSKIRGEKHYLWKGGHSRRPYRKLVKKEKCDRCGSLDNLGIHHQDNDHYNNDLKNLVVLCLSCHMSAHKTEYWAAWREGRPIPKSNGPVGWLLQKNKQQGEVMPNVPGKEFEPHWTSSDGSVKLYLGNCIDVLQKLPTISAHVCICSPPYFNLRDYNTAEWVGGNSECDHVSPFQPRSERANVSASGIGRGGAYADEQAKGATAYKSVCGKCGAKRIDQQLGAEPLHDCGTHGKAQCGGCFTCSMVAVFRGVWRVLRDDGTLWLNLGDSYAGSSLGRNDVDRMYGEESQGRGLEARSGLARGNLVSIPWRVALALQADGWILRSAMPWVKRNAMPESCDNRPSKAVEDVFLLVKSNDYYFDMEAIRRPYAESTLPRNERGLSHENKNVEVHGLGNAQGLHRGRNSGDQCINIGSGRNFRTGDLWFDSVDNDLIAFDVPVASYPGAHFATFPVRLITPMIQAGTSEHGCCSACGKPWERLINKTDSVPTKPDVNGRDRSLVTNRNGITGSLDDVRAKSSTLGWRQSCSCKESTVGPCVVLDPFIGSGTVAATAVTLGRHGVGIDLSDKYLNENAIPRIEAALCGEKVTRKVTTVILPGKAPPVKTLGRKS